MKRKGGFKLVKRVGGFIIALTLIFSLILLSGTEKVVYVDIINGKVREETCLYGLTAFARDKQPAVEYENLVNRLHLGGREEWLKFSKRRLVRIKISTRHNNYEGFYFLMAARKLNVISTLLDEDSMTREILTIRQLARDGKGQQAEDHVGDLLRKTLDKSEI